MEDVHRKVKAVSFGSFSLRLYKENEPGCRAGTRRFCLFILERKTFSTVGSRPDRRLAFFTGPKKVSKERTTLAAGMFVTV
jgi:hypothetical protein